jgi:nucleoside-diphosphate-sugar epimerase
MKALVTGGTGAVGRAFLPHLLAQGWEIVALTRHPDKAGLLQHERLSYVSGDFAQPESLRELERQPPACDVVFHLAASLDYFGDAAELTATNAGGTERMLAVARAAGARRFVYASSIEAAGTFTAAQTPPPLGATRPAATGYGASKQVAEHAVQRASAEGLSTISVRIGNVYGRGWGNFVVEFANSLLTRDRVWEYLPVFGHRYWSPVHNDDVAHGLAAAASSSHQGIVNLVGEAATIREMMHLCADALNIPFTCGRKKPFDSLYVHFYPAYQRRVHHRSDALGYIMAPRWPHVHRGFGMAESIRALGWSPTVSLRDGIRDTLAWAREAGLLAVS